MLNRTSSLRTSFVAAFTCSLAFMSLPWSTTCVSHAAGAKQSPKNLAPSDMPKSDYRLNQNVLPVRYDLSFTPDIEKAKFSGREIIDIDIRNSCSTITLNALDLKINKAILVAKDPGHANTKNSVSSDALLGGLTLASELDSKLERLTLSSKSLIPPGKYELQIDFEGTLNDKLVGFYKSSYKDKQGKTRHIATTQMEPTDARRMFPCMDEPAMKAKFKIQAVIPPHLTAISNGAVEQEQSRDGKKVVTFAETPRMSTYLVALCVGEFRATEEIVVDGVKIRVWSLERDPALGNYARNYAGKIVRYQNEYFRIPYPWGKLDLIAIPDFQAGAMENPGAITFREALLVLDEKSALDVKQACVSVIAHEMAHQWFGDLVTMAWWDDIWLNEAFATWMANKTVDNVAPEWNVMSHFFANRQGCMRTDSLHSTRSIQSPVVKPSDALQMFDDITYTKGASILKMLEVFIGDNVFQSGVVSYLKAHSFGNAATADLWAALQTASGKPVQSMMQTWCKQPGYPLMTVKELKPGQNQVSQQRFFLDGQKPGPQTWMVPFAMRKLKDSVSVDQYGRETVKPDIVQAINRPTETLQAPSSERGFVANSGGFGFYRTIYPSSNQKKILANLNLLSAGERLGLIGDQFSLAIAGAIPVESYLDTLKSFKHEQDAGVWDTILSQIGYLDLFVDKSNKSAYAAFVRELLREEYQKLAWEEKSNEALSMRLVRGSVISMLGTVGQDKEVVEKARRMFDEYLKNPESVPADLLDAVTTIVAYNGGAKEYEQMKNLFKTASTPEVELRNLYALTSYRQNSLLENVYHMVLSKEIRTQDSPRILGALFSNADARHSTWTFIKTHYADLKKIYSQQVLGRLAAYPSPFTTQAMYNDVQSFFAQHRIPEGESDKNRMLEKLRIAVRFNQKSGTALNRWLKSNG